MDGKRVKLGKCGAGEHDDENVEAGDGEDGDRFDEWKPGRLLKVQLKAFYVRNVARLIV